LLVKSVVYIRNMLHTTQGCVYNIILKVIKFEVNNVGSDDTTDLWQCYKQAKGGCIHAST